MTRRVATAAVLVLAALAALARGAGAQTSGIVTVSGPIDNPLREGNPAFTITTSGFQAAELPLKIALQIATRADFGGALLADTTVTGSSAVIVIPRLLPEHITVWWRARARTAQGALVLSDATGPRTTAAWLTLIYPNGLNGTTVDTKTPTFLWSSAAVRPPVGPWTYRLQVREKYRSVLGYVALSFSGITDTVLTSPVLLEANDPYTWEVTATLPTGDSITVQNQSSFTILSANAPIATTLFQNFPNPFPAGVVQQTCIWFDLRAQSEVHLDVFDVRGNHVANIFPGPGVGNTLLPAGRYGRAALGSDSGCDGRFTWGGRADDGRDVPPGVYVIRFRGDGQTIHRVALWKGR